MLNKTFNNFRNLSLLFILIMNIGAVSAQQCARDFLGQISCASNGGDVVRGIVGNLVCSRGKCVKFTIGRGTIMCAKTSDGAATLDVSGQPIFSVGCEEAKKEYIANDLKP